jgi:hypothetical protein
VWGLWETVCNSSSGVFGIKLTGYYMTFSEKGTPIFDFGTLNSSVLPDDAPHDLLIRNTDLGDALAGTFEDGSEMVLMTGALVYDSSEVPVDRLTTYFVFSPWRNVSIFPTIFHRPWLGRTRNLHSQRRLSSVLR